MPVDTISPTLSRSQLHAVAYAAEHTTALDTAQGGPDDNTAQGGQLIATYQKVIRSGARDAEGNLPPEVWAHRDVAATLNLNDLGSESRAVEVVVSGPSSRGSTRYDWAHGDASEDRPGTLLRALRESVGEEALAEWLTGIATSLLPPEVLQPEMHGEGVRRQASEDRSVMGDGAPPLPEDGPARAVRELREAGGQRRAPSQWRLDGQLSSELDATLSRMPSEGASLWRAVCDLWRAAQGAGLLREALPALQEDRRPDEGPDTDPEDVHRLRGTSALTVALREALHASEAAGITAPNLTGGAGVMTVRRLTPRQRECERLQGFPDGHTATSNGRPQADSPRYKQMGNAVAVPVFEWVARRIAAVDAHLTSQEKSVA